MPYNSPMYLLIDNYDSFVHNLARYFTLCGVETRVMRNDALSIPDIRSLNPAALILSPGPCTPTEAGICVEAVRTLGPALPILGVCLGHQCIGEAYGGRTIRAAQPVHGQASALTHNKTGIFQNLPSPMDVGRYHSLVVDLPPQGPLTITARSDEGIIMAVQHNTHPVYGVQFHPESILTPHGLDLVRNFVQIVRDRGKAA